MIETRILGEGYKNLNVLITGILGADLPPTELIKLERDKMGKFPKLASAIWLMQEKLTLLLWWRKSEQLMFPVESRNSMRLDRPMDSPEDWDGQIWATTLNCDSAGTTEKHFMLVLDFDK